MLGTLAEASRILVCDLLLPYEECLPWIYCPEITPGSSCKKFIEKWMQDSKNAELHLKCPSPPVPNEVPDILFWHMVSQVCLYKLFLRLPSSAGPLTWENLYSTFLLWRPPVTLGKLNLFSPFSCAYNEMFPFFTSKSTYFQFPHEIVTIVFGTTALSWSMSRDFM